MNIKFFHHIKNKTRLNNFSLGFEYMTILYVPINKNVLPKKLLSFDLYKINIIFISYRNHFNCSNVINRCLMHVRVNLESAKTTMAVRVKALGTCNMMH